MHPFRRSAYTFCETLMALSLRVLVKISTGIVEENI